jgi:PhzF family phenazine biosynthesis protein
MTLSLHLIDAFASKPFTGNPAAVVLLDHLRPDEWLQSVAMEMHQSETAFLLPQEDGYSLRWFTPMDEMDLCGHATLASAHYLYQEDLLNSHDTARFHTRSGLLTARRTADGAITLDFPALDFDTMSTPTGLAEALGVRPRECLRSTYDIICVLNNEQEVLALTPDFGALAKIKARGVIVTAQSNAADHDFVSRCFYPGTGVPEDPVTGSAHCALAPYWRDALGEDEFNAYQASPRGGMVRCEIDGDRVRLIGRAITTVRGTLLA